MSLDQQGFFWLSNPWIAALAIVMAIGLLLWCHRSLRTEIIDEAIPVPVQANRASRTPRPTESSGRHLSCQAAVEREHRDANRRRVA